MFRADRKWALAPARAEPVAQAADDHEPHKSDGRDVEVSPLTIGSSENSIGAASIFITDDCSSGDRVGGSALVVAFPRRVEYR
jgi:hypothetical protein